MHTPKRQRLQRQRQQTNQTVELAIQPMTTEMYRGDRLQSSFGGAEAPEWLLVFAILVEEIRAREMECGKVYATFIGRLLSRHSIGQQCNYGG